MKKVCIILILAMAVSTLSGCYHSRRVIHTQPWGYYPSGRTYYVPPEPKIHYVKPAPRPHHVKPAPRPHHVKPAPRPHHKKEFKKPSYHNKSERQHKGTKHIRGQGKHGG